MEWEVHHTKSSTYKGRGSTPEAALGDLRKGFERGIQEAQENLDREKKRLGRLSDLSADAWGEGGKL